MISDNRTAKVRIDLVEMFKWYLPDLDHSQFKDEKKLFLVFCIPRELTPQIEKEISEAIKYTVSQYGNCYVEKYGFYRMANILPHFMETIHFYLRMMSYTFNFYPDSERGYNLNESGD